MWLIFVSDNRVLNMNLCMKALPTQRGSNRGFICQLSDENLVSSAKDNMMPGSIEIIRRFTIIVRFPIMDWVICSSSEELVIFKVSEIIEVTMNALR